MARAGLSRVSTTELHSELRRRTRNVPRLMRKREELLRKVAEIDAVISALGGSVPGVAGGRKRPKNDSNLVEALQALLKGKTMSVTEASEAVQQAGYKTTSKTFRTIVNQTLINSGKFKRVSRGQYTAK